MAEEIIQTSCNYMDWISAGRDIIIGLSAVFTAIIAYLGLSTWQDKLKGKSEYQLAKDVLCSVYKVREAFKHVRGPAIYSYEYPENMRDHHGSLKREYSHEGTLHVYESRFEKLHEAFGELEGKHLEAQVEWGAQFQNVIIPLRKCRAELLNTIQMMLDRKISHDGATRTREERSEESSVLYYMGEDEKQDKFTPEINEAISKFEEWLRPHVDRKS